ATEPRRQPLIDGVVSTGGDCQQDSGAAMAQIKPKAARNNAMALARQVELCVLSAWAWGPAVNIRESGGTVCLAIEPLPFSLFSWTSVFRRRPLRLCAPSRAQCREREGPAWCPCMSSAITYTYVGVLHK